MIKMKMKIEMISINVAEQYIQQTKKDIPQLVPWPLLLLQKPSQMANDQLKLIWLRGDPAQKIERERERGKTANYIFYKNSIIVRTKKNINIEILFIKFKI